jgi:hypothetical protein
MIRLFLACLVGAATFSAGAAAEDDALQRATELTDKLSLEEARAAGSDRTWTIDFRHRSYDWHLLSTKIIFYVVHGIVVFGCALTYIQLTQNANRRRPRPNASALESTGVPNAVEPAASSLKIGPTGVEISSQVIGLLILGFSLAFFYLYITRVYPMVEAMHKAAASGSP